MMEYLEIQQPLFFFFLNAPRWSIYKWLFLLKVFFLKITMLNNLLTLSLRGLQLFRTIKIIEKNIFRLFRLQSIENYLCLNFSVYRILLPTLHFQNLETQPSIIIQNRMQQKEHSQIFYVHLKIINANKCITKISSEVGKKEIKIGKSRINELFNSKCPP